MDMLNLVDLELRHLAALRAVAEEGTFGRAAGRLGFSQSAVSQQIAALERMLGEPLFERPGGPRPVSLTAAGEVLLPHAVAILDRVRVTEADMNGFLSGESGTLRIGTFQSVSVRILPDLLTELAEEHPGIEVRLFESDDQDVLLDRLRSGDLDLTFAVMPIDDAEDLTIDILCQDPFVALAPLDSQILPGVEGPSRTADLDGLPVISQPQTSCQEVIGAGSRLPVSCPTSSSDRPTTAHAGHGARRNGPRRAGPAAGRRRATHPSRSARSTRRWSRAPSSSPGSPTATSHGPSRSCVTWRPSAPASITAD